MVLIRCKHPTGKISTMMFGLCTIADGLVRVLSFGNLCTTLPIAHSRNAVKKHIKQLKEARNDH